MGFVGEDISTLGQVCMIRYAKLRHYQLSQGKLSAEFIILLLTMNTENMFEVAIIVLSYGQIGKVNVSWSS